jgi:hypothetical protein
MAQRLLWNRVKGKSQRWLALGAASAVLAPTAVFAAQLSINGVPIGKVDLKVQGLENITFEKCTTMKVEPNGDVKIDCPGYDLQGALPAQPAEPVKPATPATPQVKVTKRYWLVTSQTQPGATQFDVDVYVNGKWAQRFKNDEAQKVFELSKYLVQGPNKIIFAATKNLADARKSTSADAQYRFVLGEGDIAGANLRIDKVLLDLKRTAAEGENVTDERDISAN